MRSRYQLAFYESTGKLAYVHSLIATDQMRYAKRIGDVSPFLLALPWKDYHPVMRQKDALVRVFRTDPLTNVFAEDGIYFLRAADDVPGDYEGFVCTGYSPEYLLDGRVYDPEDDPLVANGYSTKGAGAATVMREIVVEQCISPAVHTERKFPGLTAMTLLSDTSPYCAFRREISQETVLNALQQIREAHHTDFWFEFGDPNPLGYFNLEFKVGRLGQDRSKHSYPNGPYVYLSATSGNLTNPQLTTDCKDEKTCVYVLGQGANGHRLVYRESGSAVADSPYARREVVVDVNGSELSLDLFLDAAKTGLAENRARTVFTFGPVLTAEGAVYEKDWDLGDIITAGHRDLEYDMRIIGVEITPQADGEAIAVEMELHLWE